MKALYSDHIKVDPDTMATDGSITHIYIWTEGTNDIDGNIFLTRKQTKKLIKELKKIYKNADETKTEERIVTDSVLTDYKDGYAVIKELKARRDRTTISHGIGS